MKRVWPSQLAAGMTLVEHVVDGKGRVLIRDSVTLDDAAVQRLQRMNLARVAVYDERYAESAPDEPVAAPLQYRAMEWFADWRQALDPARPEPCIDHDSVRALVAALEGELNTVPGTPVVLIRATEPAYYFAIQALNAARLTLVLAKRLNLHKHALDIAMGAFVCDVALQALAGQPGHDWPEDEMAPTPTWAQQHPRLGVAALRLPRLWSAYTKLVVGQHHERLDGSGYPLGLTAADIQPAAALVGVVDAYLGLVFPPPGRIGLLPEQALEYLFAYAGSQFPLDVVRELCRCVGLYEPGTLVKLSTGSDAVVLQPGCGTHFRPTVYVLQQAATLDLQGDAGRSVQIVEIVQE